MNPLNPLGIIHDHVDGCVSMRPMLDDKYGEARTSEIIRKARIGLRSVRTRQASLSGLFNFIYNILQNGESIQKAGYLYGKLRFEQGYKKAEGIFAPQYLINKALTLRQATAAMYRGLKDAEKEFGINITPTIAIGRDPSMTPIIANAIARIACDYDGEMILDLVCDEIGYPPELFLPAFKLTFGTNVKRVCHVEVVAATPTHTYWSRIGKNLETALVDMRCHGIQHGSGLIHHPDLIKYVVDHGIRIAGAPLSNLDLGLVVDIREIGIGRLLDAGVCYTLGPDDDLFMRNLKEVARICNERCQFTEQQCRQLEAYALRDL